MKILQQIYILRQCKAYHTRGKGMDTREQIEEYVSKLSLEDCSQFLKEHIENDIFCTKKVIEMGIDPLAPGTPYFPDLWGQLYIEEGEKFLEKFSHVNERFIRELIVRIIDTFQYRQELAKKYKSESMEDQMFSIGPNIPVLNYIISELLHLIPC